MSETKKQIVYENHPIDGRVQEMGDACSTVTSKFEKGCGDVPLVMMPTVEVAGSLSCNTGPNGHDAGNFACNQAVDSGHLIPIVYENHPIDGRVQEMGDVCDSVCARYGTGGGNVPLVQHASVCIPISTQNALGRVGGIDDWPMGIFKDGDPSPTLSKSHGHAVATNINHANMQVRKLTPTECERLQGFPDGYTNIPWRGKPESPDGPRYKALGNSMAVPCMEWIGRRIQMVDEIMKGIQCSP